MNHYQGDICKPITPGVMIATFSDISMNQIVYAKYFKLLSEAMVMNEMSMK